MLRWTLSLALMLLAVAALIIAVVELGYGLQGYTPAWIAFGAALAMAAGAIWGARWVVRRRQT